MNQNPHVLVCASTIEYAIRSWGRYSPLWKWWAFEETQLREDHIVYDSQDQRFASRTDVHCQRLERYGSIDLDGQSASGARDRSQQGAKGDATWLNDLR